MSRELKIKESCSCGAVFEGYETREESWEHSELKWRQDAFHEAHKDCNRIEVSGKPLTPPKYKPKQLN